MRRRDLIVFLTTALTIYSLANVYIFLKGFKALSETMHPLVYAIIFLALASTFVFGKILERNSSSVIVDILNVTGGFWLAIMLYSSLLFLISDIAWLIGNRTNMQFFQVETDFRYKSFFFVLFTSIIILIIGFFNSISTVSRSYKISLDKTFNGGAGIRIVAISDVHLGSIVRKRSLRKISKMLASEKPDILVFLGDLVDGEINPVLRDDLLNSLEIPDNCKVRAITGNHEYIGGIDKTLPYLRKHGIKVLLDEVEQFENGLQIIGRKDRDSERYSGSGRMKLAELIEKTDPELPIILLDHQPLPKNARAGNSYDLMLSGHTHNGQMWPFNYLVNLVYKDSYGYKNYNGGHHIVSSGFGTWGPRIRLGSRSEILSIDLNGKKG